eukprot:913010_1
MKRERSDDESESGNAPEKRKKHSLNAAMRLTVVKNSVHLSAVSEDGIPSLEASLNEGSSTDLPLESGQEVTIKTADGRTLRFTIDGSEQDRQGSPSVTGLDHTIPNASGTRNIDQLPQNNSTNAIGGDIDKDQRDESQFYILEY